MKRLVERYTQGNEVDKMLLASLQLHVWNKPSTVLCCKKGVQLFIEQNEHEIMYNDLCELFKVVKKKVG